MNNLENADGFTLAVTPNSHNEGAIWSPDGKKIAFNSTREQNADIWIMDVGLEQLKEKLLTVIK